MKGKAFMGELKAIFSNKKLLIPIIAVMIIPVMYSGMFLWAFWDPYENLSDLPVAIVNEDAGSHFNEKQLELGKELVDNLKDSDQFNFVFVEKDKGYENLENQKYYMLVEIPKDFSGNATTLLDENPKKLQLKYVPNEGYNFLSAQIGDTAIEKIKAAISEQIIKTYSETMFDTVKAMADGYQDASENANKLYDGLSKVNEGTTSIKNNLALLAEKQIQFKSGIDEVYSGVQKLSKGSNDLSTGLGALNDAEGQLNQGAKDVKSGIDQAAVGSNQLNTGINKANKSMQEITEATKQLETGAGTLSTNLDQWSKKADEASEGAKKLNEGIQTLKQKLQPISAALPPSVQKELETALIQAAAGSKQLADGTGQLSGSASQLSSGSKELTSGLSELNAGQNALQQGMNQLTKGSDDLNNGLAQLQTGQNKLVNSMGLFGSKLQEASEGSNDLNRGLQDLSAGMLQLENGSSQLSDGTNKLSAGATELATGTTEAANGSKEFKEAIGSAAKESSNVRADDKTYDMMSNPLNVEKEPVDHVPNYGTGFAPYFVSLGLFVGALMLSIVYPMREPAVVPKNAFSWFLSKYGVMAIVGVIQALLADIILLGLLNIEVQSIPLFIFFSIITSLTFISIIQFLVTSFGDPGRFIAIVILILQLTTSAGTFPLELIPKVLQYVNAFLPMTYTVQGFKAVISSGNYDFMWYNAALLGGFILVFMAGTMYYFTIKYKKQYARNDEAMKA